MKIHISEKHSTIKDVIATKFGMWRIGCWRNNKVEKYKENNYILNMIKMHVGT